MNNIKSIELIFENCESIEIPFERFNKLEYGELIEMKYDEEDDENFKYTTNYTYLEITYEDKNELQYDPMLYNDPLGMFVDNPTSNKVEDRPNILGRILNHDDLVCVEFKDDNDKIVKLVYVPWSDDDYNNEFMKTSAEDGLIKIEIKENE